MNIFRFVADMLHLLSFFIIIYKLHKTKNCRGVSCQTQEIYLLVFATRYLDLFMYFISLYNTLMKIAFICATVYIIYLMKLKAPINSTYAREKDDDFPHLLLIPFALVLTFIIHTEFSWWELSWSFSLWLEAVAIIPQISILNKTTKVEPFTAHYIASLGTYRFFYIINWIYRYYTEHTYCWTSIITGILQSLLYADFLYLYFRNIKNTLNSDLPLNMDEKEALK